MDMTKTNLILLFYLIFLIDDERDQLMDTPSKDGQVRFLVVEHLNESFFFW